MLTQLELWLEDFYKVNTFYPPVTEQTAVEAVSAICNQKNSKLIKKTLHLFNAACFKVQMIEILKKLIKQQDFTSACRIAVSLELFNQFRKEDFVLPLIVQDKLSLAEEYLRNDIMMLRDVVMFLDQYLNQPYDMLPHIS